MSNTHVHYLEDQDFDQQVLQTNKPVLVDFYADWCGPCQALSPKLDELGEKFADQANIIKVNVDKHPELASRYEVRSIPALFFFKDGELKNRLQGNQPAPVLEQELAKIV